MKYVIISADGDQLLYSVPDIVADNLKDYCMNFCCKWLYESPHAAKYRNGNCLCYDASDFIEYLNNWIFPNEKSILIKNLGCICFDGSLPEPFNNYPKFNF